MDPLKHRPKTASPRAERGDSLSRPAFTLIELLAILAIVVILLSIGAASSVHWGREARMRSSVGEVTATLDAARQWARTHGNISTFAFTNPPSGRPGTFALIDAQHGLIGRTNTLKSGIVWTYSFRPVHFSPDGTCPGTNRVLVLTESHPHAHPLVSTITVYTVTGQAVVEPSGY